MSTYQRERLITHGNTVIDIHTDAQLILNADLIVGANLRSGSNAETYLKLHKGAKLIVNGTFKLFFGVSIEVFPDGVLILDGGYVNTGTVIACAKKITIGSGAAIARGVYIYDSDHHKLIHNGEYLNPAKPIIIGKHVWICVGASILKGVSIGDGAVIGAASVVTKDVSERSLAVGNPAKVIRDDIEWH